MRSWMDIAGTFARWSLSIVVLIALLALTLLRTAPGHDVLASAIGALSDGTVSVKGLRGDLPDDLHAAMVEVSDKNGIWLRVENLTLDWDARRALSNHIKVERVTASRVVLLRMPQSEESNGTTPKIDIAALDIARIEIARAAAGHAAVLRARGSLHYRSVHHARADLDIARLDRPGSYRVQGAIDRDVANGTIAIAEGADGILGALIGLPGLNPIHLTAQAAGTAAANTLSFNLSAGALRAAGRGTIALARHSAAIAFSAHAPAMKLASDIGWQSLALQGDIRGALDAPHVAASLRVSEPAFAGMSAGALSADVSGDRGMLHAVGAAEGLRVPGDRPDLFARAPVQIDATIDLTRKTMPVAFSLSHPLLAIRGHADTQGKPRVSATVTVPSLAPFAALQNAELGGSAQFQIDAAQNGSAASLAVDGRMRTTGSSAIARLLGQNATLTLRAATDGADITQSHILLQGAGVRSETTGTFRNKSLNYAVALALPDLSRLAPALTGSLSLSGIANGPLDTASLHLSGKADMASRGFARQTVGIDIQATGLTKLSSAQLRASGSFDNAPVLLAATWSGGQRGQAKLSADWRSVRAKAELALPASGAIAGPVQLDIGNLADIALVTGSKLAGSLKALIDLKSERGKTAATLRADANAIAIGDARAASASIHGGVGDPFGHPMLALAISAQGLQGAGMRGTAQGRIDGPTSKLAVALTSDLQDASDNPVHLAADAVLDLPKSRATIQRFDARWREQTLTLRAPAAVDFAHGLSVDRFSATIAGGTLDLSGAVMPKLALKLSAQAIDVSALKAFLPQIDADGRLSATAQLSGTLDAPRGTVTLQGRGLRARNYSGTAIAPADVDAHATLQGATAALTATLTAGKSAHLTLSGEAPLKAGAKADLHAEGKADLAMLNPILLSEGRQARGNVTVNVRIAGTMDAPYATGAVTVTDGDIQDFARGARIRDIAMTVDAEGARLRIVKLTARAGPGTIDGSGTIDLAAPGMPVDIALKAHEARPIVSELMTATLSGDVKLSGKLRGISTLSGKLFVTHGEINLPERFPPDVAVLDVRRRGEKPPPPPAEPSTVALDLTVASSSQIFVRGHGIDANLGGRIHLTGTTGAPFVSGGFEMERGTFSLAGQTLDFTTGKLSFDGTGVRYRLDPTLNFVAQTTSGGVTATLTIGGYASAPKIALTSAPQLPQDEILAHLLFQQSTKQLTPLQLAQIAQAIAALGGVGNGFNPLGALRKGLGLDRLSVGSTTGGASGSESQTTVEAGKYVARNVYVGAKQNLSGGTQVQIQVDLTKRLKAQATLSTMTNATATKGNAAQDNGSSVGLSYEFEY